MNSDDSTSGPKVVVFDESVLKKAPVIESRAARRAFMASFNKGSFCLTSCLKGGLL